ncbi:aminoacyltransferase [Furfurilactobacillus rossiae]|uniref:Aminoacyltransferase FemA n=1 Tax=Furfurilactobacillus rossiae DSM 15814 TaxID=1114972 RepID=A0A0R1RWN9_9LACO|nr:aminoacyltransferase [Furfurilactobacillus rossiae]KRL57496.1 methicillin resistance factor FemA [Furfurilactobacillus rossiae DSM 15814]QFR65644.1 peptidoglycan bridge formation glycyltransferase FemA/FemB family protein [Furfurilactobacillus rossiae]QLE61034.1 FemAB protein [Furfurilactobacillus rossiae]
MNFKELDKDTYYAFEQQHPQGSYTQTPEQKEVLSRRNIDATYVGVTNEHGQVIAAALLTSEKLRMGYLFEVNGGPMMDYGNAELVKVMTDGMVSYAKQHHGLVLRWLPNVISREFDDDGKVIATPNQDAIANLTAAGFSHSAVKPGYSTIELGYQFVKKMSGITADNVVASYQKDAQYALKKTKQFGIKLRQLDYDELPQFKKYTEATAERLNFNDKTLDYYQATYKAYGDKVQFIVAELNFDTYIANQQKQADKLQERVDGLDAKLKDKPNNKHIKSQRRELSDQISQHEKRIKEAEGFKREDGQSTILSGGMFFIQPQEIAYMFSFTNEEFKNFYAPYMVQNHMIHVAIENHVPLYNFYGVSGMFDGSDGVLGFKQSFTGVTQEMLGAFTKPVKPFQYRLYEWLKKVTGRE